MKKHKRDILALAAKYRKGDITPPCAHFGECGGCLFQDIPYDDQLRLKLEYLDGIFAGAAEVTEIFPSPPLGYRNRMDYVTAFGRLGLRRAGRYRQVVDILSCDILQEKSCVLFKKLRPLLAGIEDYDYVTHRGYLRYAVFRQGYFTGECMINLVTAKEEDRVSDVLGPLLAETDSSSLLLSGGLADLSQGPVFRTLKGGYITEDFDGIRFRITPNSFFQSNSPVARELYRRIRDLISGESVLDLYSGVGSISLYIAGKAGSVTGVEISAEAVEAAKVNALDNGISNVDFVCADALTYLAGNIGGFDTVVLDPPRAGTHPKMIRRLNELGPRGIIYVSCNPVSFRQDLAALEGYRLESLTAFDMFPQTPHVETLGVLRRI
jgi:23S rRNA (uracil-5-)-methyltransferase RumA